MKKEFLLWRKKMGLSQQKDEEEEKYEERKKEGDKMRDFG